MTPSTTPERLTPAEHRLKTWPEYFQEVMLERKTFEIRLNDRNFQVGDTLILREWSKRSCEYTGRECVRVVTYITEYEQRRDYVVMAIKPPDELRAAAYLETQEAPADFVDKVKAFNLMLTAVNPTVRRLAERYLEGVKDYDAFVDFLRNHPLEALPKPPEAR